MISAERERLSAIEDLDGTVVYGNAGEELNAFAAGVDLMIVGARGRGPVGRLLNGSVSTYLARHLSCPLLVLPRSLSGAGATPPVASPPDTREPAVPAS